MATPTYKLSSVNPDPFIVNLQGSIDSSNFDKVVEELNRLGVRVILMSAEANEKTTQNLFQNVPTLREVHTVDYEVKLSNHFTRIGDSCTITSTGFTGPTGTSGLSKF